MDEIVKDFLIESMENLDRLDQELVKLETDPQSKELLASIFRTIHTIKGSAGFLGFARLGKVAHAGENLLSRLREGEQPLTAEVTSGLLAMVDAVRHMLSEIERTESDGENDYRELLETLERLQGTEGNSPENAGRTEGEAASPDARQPPPEERAPVALGPRKQEDILAAQQTTEARGRETGVETVRVGVNLLDRLMNLVGELVLARNQLLQFAGGTSDAGVHTISQRMNLIASELQEEVMKTRMQPIGNVWSKFPRTVRDLALGCGKEVRLEMEGQDTELDRTIIEAVKDPLTHLVRNAVDHGIETPAVRQKAGKTPSGCVRLRAFHEGGQVNIEIGDDGAGLDVERIRAKAVERGMISAGQAARMTEHEVFSLIFLPGFSTAEKVTNISGRGVGMDVVRTNLEKIAGTVDLESAAGKGTTVRIKIPLTLAIIPALVVRCNGERLAIPQISITELVRLESGQGIERVHRAPVYRLRGQLLPLVYLRDVLYPAEGDGLSAEDDKRAVAPETVNIAVLEAGSGRFGLVVDDVLDTEEIVVKPLGKQLKGISAYAGATIMGDGSVSLILDVAGVARQAGIFTEARESAEAESAGSGADNARSTESRALLLAEAGGTGQVAIPLGAVARLEEFPVSVIEHAGPQEAMQYRGKIIPLIRLSEIAAATTATSHAAASIQVVIYSEGGRTVGLIVDRIVDIVGEVAQAESVHLRPGVSGTCVVGQRVTDLLDVPAIVRHAIPGFLEARAAMESSAGART